MMNNELMKMKGIFRGLRLSHDFRGQPYLIILFFLIFFSASPLTAQVTVNAVLDSTNMLIGDQMQLHLLVNHSPNIKIENPELSVLEESKIEVLSVTEWDTLGAGGEIVLQKNITFTAWDSGYVWIPKIPVPYEQNGQTGVKMTNEIPLNVHTIPVDSTLTPIKDIIAEPRTLEDFIPVFATLFGFFLLAGLIYYFWKRRQAEPLPPPVKIKIPAHEFALNQLDALKKQKLWQQGKIKIYQSELTHIVREYLESRYHILALESTTDELLKQLKNIEIEGDWKDKLREMLQTADLVKFAKAEPPIEIHDKMMSYAEDFIYATQPQKLQTAETEEEASQPSEKAEE